MKPTDIALALDNEARGPIVLADDCDFHGQCERVVLAVLGQYDGGLRIAVDAHHQRAAVVTHGADDIRRLHVMLAEAPLDNRRQELLNAFVHLRLGLLSATIWRQSSALLLDLDQRFRRGGQ